MDSGPEKSTTSKSVQSVIIEMTPVTGEMAMEMSPVSREVTG